MVGERYRLMFTQVEFFTGAQIYQEYSAFRSSAKGEMSLSSLGKLRTSTLVANSCMQIDN
jgi:hypothetical protein